MLQRARRAVKTTTARPADNGLSPTRERPTTGWRKNAERQSGIRAETTGGFGSNDGRLFYLPVSRAKGFTANRKE